MNKSIYPTSDYTSTVVLSALGFKLLSVDRSDYHRAVFEFQFDEKIPKVIEAFFKDELSLNPRLVLLHAKLVKDRLHAAQ